MGQQKRYNQAVGGFEIPTGARRHDIDDAAQAIVDHVAETGQAGIYNGDGTWRAAAADELLAPMLAGPDRMRRGERVDGKDTILEVRVGETFADVQDRLCRSRHYASPRMVTRYRVADVFYAAIGAGITEQVSSERVEAAVDMAFQLVEDGTLHKRALALHAEGLREFLGLPGGPWTDSAADAAERGRAMTGGTPAEAKSAPHDENAWAL